jgi:hypothetical protein
MLSHNNLGESSVKALGINNKLFVYSATPSAVRVRGLECSDCYTEQRIVEGCGRSDFRII